MSPTAPRTIRLETERYIVRTLETTDATENWRHWMTDPATMRNLNINATVLSDDQIRAYIGRFDRQTSHLLGIFEKDGGRLIGIRAIYIDPDHREFLLNVLVGESDARNRGARAETLEPIFRYFFDDLDLLAVNASAVSTNEPILRKMESRGWTRLNTSTKAAANGQGPVQIHTYRLTRDQWRKRSTSPDADGESS
ncbi:MAG: GNAT family protein [Micropepsaceae bacterium]